MAKAFVESRLACAPHPLRFGRSFSSGSKAPHGDAELNIILPEARNLGLRRISLQEVALYDQKRRPASWMEIIQPGQYAVFHKEAHTEIASDSEGKLLSVAATNTCLIFDSLDEAKGYCELRVRNFPKLRCEIFDSAGKAKPPLAIILNPALAGSLEESPASGKRKVATGIALMALSIPLFLWDWASPFVPEDCEGVGYYSSGPSRMRESIPLRRVRLEIAPNFQRTCQQELTNPSWQQFHRM